MKNSHKRQLLFLSINIFILLAVFLTLFIYDNYVREPLIVYRRPIVFMEKQFVGSNPLFEKFDKMDLFAQYKGTRAVGSEKPEKMVLLIAHPSYEQNFHFSHLLYEAYRLKCGLVIMDFKNIRNYIPIEDESGQILSTEQRNRDFLKVMMSYMEQYGFTQFRIAYLGTVPDQMILDSFSSSILHIVPHVPVSLKEVLSIEQETEVIDNIFDF